MKSLQVELGARSYPIYIGSDLLQQADLFSRHIDSRQVMVVSNETVAPLYLQKVLNSLAAKQVETIILPDGESFKTLSTTETIFDALIGKRFSRNATIIALGGGVVGDISGFAAACYQRGISFVQVPTSLLAQVDSSVGGKTGVNHPRGKNMIGAFHQPRCVIIDTTVLDTLADRELSAGMAEVIKYGLIRDAEFFLWLEENIAALMDRDPETTALAIERCCCNKADIVIEDERESGVRALLNLGHTFGHAIETGCGYGTYLHGEAVAIGICQAADLSRRLGWLDKPVCERITTLLTRAGLPVTPPTDLSVDQYLDLMAVDKKNIDGNLRLVLLKSIGQAVITADVNSTTLKQTLSEYGL